MISQTARPHHIDMTRALLSFSHNEACHIADADGCPPQHLHLQPPPTGKRLVIKDIQDLAAYQIQRPSWPQRHSRGHPSPGGILGGWCHGSPPQPLGRGGDLRKVIFLTTLCPCLLSLCLGTRTAPCSKALCISICERSILRGAAQQGGHMVEDALVLEEGCHTSIDEGTISDDSTVLQPVVLEVQAAVRWHRGWERDLQ